MTNNTTAATITVNTRGCETSLLTDATRMAWARLYRFSAMQVWTWRGGEALVVKDFDANYGRGEYAVIVRTGGRKRGTVRTLYVSNFAQAMEAMGIRYRISTGMRPKRERSATQQNRDIIARFVRSNGGIFRTLRARPRLQAAA